MTINQQIRQARRKQGVNQSVLALRTGISPTAISEFETGKEIFSFVLF